MRLFSWHRSYFFFFILMGLSCRERPKPDISNIQLAIQIERFDQELSQLKANEIHAAHAQWLTVYPYFYSDFTQHIFSIGDPEDTATIQRHYTAILESPEFNTLKNDIQKTFPTLSQQEAELSQAFKYVRYYFPDTRIPRFIAFFSGFNVQIPIGKDYIGIGLDMFLGQDSPYYRTLTAQIPRYISRRFTPDYIAPRVMETYLRGTLYPAPSSFGNFLDQMIYEGKILYLMEHFLPNTTDTLLMGYTSRQMAWAKQYESDIWTYFIAQELLFQHDLKKTQKYIGEAPFTPGLGQGHESAPKLGAFIGWQMVRRYMDHYPETSLPELLALKDNQMLLKKSEYRGE